MEPVGNPQGRDQGWSKAVSIVLRRAYPGRAPAHVPPPGISDNTVI
jgi:hypothetical protein